MLFNNLGFLFVFLPMTLLVVLALAPARVRPHALIICSLIFYGSSGTDHAVVLLACVVWVYVVIDRWFAARVTLTALWLAISGPLCALVYYKYSSFLLQDVLMLGEPTADGTFSLFQSIVLPAGISFFTFQLIGYAIDRYRGAISRAAGFRNLLLFISFFPQLIAGPIVRFHQVAARIDALAAFRLDRRDVSEAVVYLSIGLAYKVLLADSINHFLEPIVAEPETLGSLGLLSVTYSYTFQIYFDFYGYSLCAIGLAKLFGITLPDNFLRPYSTLSPRDFWRCWHVTLSNFIRDYIYIPLGGNKRYLRNILIVFLICGLWHGAGYAFLVWGAYHFALVGGYRLVEPVWNAAPIAVQWFANFTLVSFGWLLFLYPMKHVFAALESTRQVGDWPSPDLVVATLAAALVCFAIRPEQLAAAVATWAPMRAAAAGVTCAVLMVAVVLLVDRSATFIYFRF